MRYLKNTICSIMVAGSFIMPAKAAIQSQYINEIKSDITTDYEKFLPKEYKLNMNVASMASWYGPGFYGNLTASGERYVPGLITAAHKTLPFGTRVRVTNKLNGRSIVVRINDRGPYIGGRSLDLSEAAASRIGMIGSGVVPIKMEVLN